MNYWGKTKIISPKKDGTPRKISSDRRVLTPEQVMAMRRGERDYKDVAKEVGISITATWFAKHGYSYKDLPES